MDAVSTEEVFAIDLNVFPNPAQHHLTFTTEANINSAKIYDSQGQAVASYTNLSQGLDVSRLNDGVYTILFTTIDHKQIIKSFVKVGK